jgi:serine/threonine protein kinase
MADVTEKLERLANLLEKGLITREEFDEEKANLRATARLASTPPTSSTNPGSSPNLSDAIGAYRILGELGQGGMGVVVRAKHRTAAIAKRQGGEVAIKVLHAQYAQDEVFRDRFEREASMGLKLDHPNIVKVHDLVIDGGNLALVMDLAAGRPLSEVIGHETGPIPWERAWPMFKQILAAVSYAHEHNVVHRDIKPENVIVSPKGKLKVLDFGIAKAGAVHGRKQSGPAGGYLCLGRDLVRDACRPPALGARCHRVSGDDREVQRGFSAADYLLSGDPRGGCGGD